LFEPQFVPFWNWFGERKSQNWGICWFLLPNFCWFLEDYHFLHGEIIFEFP
jgi:hypothetical protein